MRYAVVARVTPEDWTACAVLDKLGFGLKVGDSLKAVDTLCSEVVAFDKAIVIEDAASDKHYAGHAVLKLHNVGSYVAVPVTRPNGDCFGTLCALDRVPARLSQPGLLQALKLFARMICIDMESQEQQDTLAASDIILEERTERLREWDVHQKLMLRELAHRVKNSFAVLQAILRSTLKSTPDPQDFARAFSGRLHSLSAAQDSLTASNWHGVELGELARNQLDLSVVPGDKRLTIKGPKVNLATEYASSLGLILHELATNATRHGALSVPSGEIDLSWRLEADAKIGQRLYLTWRESGGPAMSSFPHKGYGTSLIERSLAAALVELRHEPEGIVCTIVLPLTSA